jgi:hypothetical protein
MRVIFYVETLEDFLAVNTVAKWLDNSIFYTSTKSGCLLLEANGVKFRYIKDVRILTWEMARFKPKVYVDTCLLPELFPRNGEKTVYIPNFLGIPTNEDDKAIHKLLYYDYLFLQSPTSLKKVQSDLGLSTDALFNVGYPKLENYEQFPEFFSSIDANLANYTLIDEDLVYKNDRNAGLRAATLIYRIGLGNNQKSLNLPSATHIS